MTLVKHTYRHKGDFVLEQGSTLQGVEFVYHSSVAPEDIDSRIKSGAKVIWICHALTANSDPSDWWSDLVGSGKFFNSEKDIIICANTLGSCYGSTSPSNWNGGKPLDFPIFSVRDIVSGHIEIRKHLGIESVDLLIGASVGGFQSIEWAIREPQTIKKLVLIACNERITPWATALNESQRLAIRADQTFEEQASLDGGRSGLMAARSIALLSYRSYSGYNLTQSEKDSDCYQAERAASYQVYQGEKLANRYDAYSYYYMTLMLDTHNVGRGRGSVESALKSIAAKTLVVAIDSDILFPPKELQKLSELIPDAQYAEISSAFGHDGFLIEWELLTKILTQFLNN